MKDVIRSRAIELAKEHGLINLTRETLCAEVGIPVGSFPNIMGCTFTRFVNSIVGDVGDEGFGHPAKTNRANPDLRRTQILNVAIEVSKDVGYQNITRAQIAKLAGTSEGLVSRYFSTMTQLKRDIMRTAVKKGIHEIIAQGLASNDKQAKKADQEVKQKALEFLAG